MAAPRRNRSKPDDPAFQKTREKIRTTKIAQRLEAFVLEEKYGNSKKPVEMTSSQVTAALGLLKKTIPDLSATEISGPDGGPVVPTINITKESTSKT